MYAYTNRQTCNKGTGIELYQQVANITDIWIDGTSRERSCDSQKAWMCLLSINSAMLRCSKVTSTSYALGTGLHTLCTDRRMHVKQDI